jgi:protein-L-isoaspartate(D-aspartate) O-methyltransferase
MLMCLLFASSCYKDSLNNYDIQRKKMVEQQIIKRGIKDKKVLEALLKVPRHEFVPAEYKINAYEDRPLPIGEGQTISQPYIVAFMTEILELKGTEKVLEIGTGSGYQAAILAEIVKEVYTIEIIETLGKKAEKKLNEMGYKNIKVKIGDGYKGWNEYAPFDAIIVTAAPKKIPEPLLEQLAEGGRMIIPVGDYFQELIFVKKQNNKISQQSVLPVKFVPMIGEVEK